MVACAKWDTDEEIKYIRGIGAHGDPKCRDNEPVERRKARLLRGYITSAKLRADWGRIDGATVISYAEKELVQAEKSLM